MTETLSVAYRDHDRTPLLYVIKDQAARFEGLELDIRHVPGGEDYRSGFLNGHVDLVCEHLRLLFPARLKGHPIRCIAATQIESVDRFVAASPIRSADDIRGKRIAVMLASAKSRSVSSSRVLLRKLDYSTRSSGWRSRDGKPLSS